MGLHSASKVWKRDEIAALIALYETEQCLYDSKHKDFNDSEKQNEAYERIHRVMLRIRPNCSIGEIKYKINFLQRQYSGELLHRNISVKAGLCTEGTYKSGMWCFGLLQFLDDFLPLTKTVITKKTVTTKQENRKSVNENTEKVTCDTGNNHDLKDVAGTSDADSETDAIENTVQSNSGKKRKLENASSSTNVAENMPEESSFDREDIFGQYVASEMKALKVNPLLYLQTKQTILEILTSANFELINPE